MLETTRYETSRRLRGTVILTIGVSLYVAFIVWYFSLVDASAYAQIAESVPPAMREAFGIQTIGTIEGWLGGQIYTFVWLVGLGIYFAYSAAGKIASDIENDRMDLLLSFPVSRSQLLLEKFASMVLPLVLLNVVVGGVTYGLVLAIGETIDPMHLVLAHLLSIPYLLVCAAIGTVLSVLVNRAAVAERAAIGLMFVLWLVESAVGAAEEFSWIQYISPTHYYSPTPVLIDGTYEVMDSGILLAGFLGLLIVSQVLFQRRDI
ncbi:MULTISPECIES: ABC transporter permease subunit [Natrialbaceae]|uniref:ABC transporter permease n=1 Tax=Salinadaptatus halalkaliphilus TaxID=2419781 RepID=A0A4S3TMI8_9EURY|nr:ABC transporter permease subunit [Natrialba sp. INN-245]MWV40181.1 ABC transporter permease subunit [Natrialba sp. INN-245]THE64255.1 ABC transporter permease [Salinadaptatus halalkaliphilus]